MKPTVFSFVLLAAVLCTSCAVPTVAPTPTPTIVPSPTPEPKVLSICSLEEPESLYIYGSSDTTARHVWQAIYDGPFDRRGYGYQPIILTRLPNLTNGGAAMESVAVGAGERVVAADGDVVELAPGVPVEDSDGRRVTFDGGTVLMPQMVVTFNLQANLYWSDGTVLTADDSVFSFELAADPATPVDKTLVDRTAEYWAVDPRVVVWRGVPGFLDHYAYLNFWHPLPRRAWGALSAADLLTADVAVRQPLGWGPFVMREWVPGSHITMVRNPIYFRAPGGLPRLDEVTYRFIPDPIALAEALLDGRCNLVTHEAAEVVLAALPNEPGVQVLSTTDVRWELLAFGISPGPDYDRPDFFEDVRVRQAVALCIDRQSLAERALSTSASLLHSFVPPEHPLYAEDLAEWGFDPVQGQTLLASVGWRDEDGDGIREAHAIPGIVDGTPFEVTYHTTDDALRVETSQRVRVSLQTCGVGVRVELLPAGELFEPGPEGVLFGRRFDLAQFSWRATADPLCDLFLSGSMPDIGRWEGANVAGFLDDAFDEACLSALRAVPGSETYVSGHIKAQRIFAQRLPALPLYQHSRSTLADGTVIGLTPDSTQTSELWNIEQLDLHR